jgi:ATP-dependent Clp protease ATP-binding subunit ClpA
MFDRYTEKARRVIFFARYEASQFGSFYIEAEHILLGLGREDHWLMHVFRLNAVELRDAIGKSFPAREKVPTSVDMPLDNAGKRILAHAAEEAERLADRQIGTEHIFLGILHEEKTLAAQLLFERGIRLQEARTTIASRYSAPKEELGADVGSESTASFRSAPVMVDRCIEFQNEDGTSVLGRTMVLDVPRVGEEVVLAGTRARVTKVTYHYEPATPPGELVPSKVVVSVQLL